MKDASSKKISEEIVNFPDGEYDALWSGYSLEILDKDYRHLTRVKTINGVRGINCKVKIEIVNGEIFEV